MDFDPDLPIYLQIMNDIKRQIFSGALAPGDKLPSVRELAESIKVNPNTIVRSYQELEREGVTETRRGTGTFVGEDEKMLAQIRTEQSQRLVRNFLRQMKSSGFSREQIASLVEAAFDDCEERSTTGGAI
ncbi:GntR family transcriptional regulator [Treponema brennaborense]|uniref:Transcriptional regulator, GntR family n=1 Tax=Treponema brennaborense (strain DSM 12168 / CIP 105900 / DD5/3) TaxID=906968 RepID=F4LQ86_TREBD|nr:GntR family transcriptional regulator [Treponema brennaborense]AEE16107.1 transcriptional regulator, GntR family [Treponema brennaborense DSM 12168]